MTKFLDQHGNNEAGYDLSHEIGHDLVVQYQHRLQVLEAELTDDIDNQLLEPRIAKQRQQRLAAAQARLRNLERALAAKSWDQPTQLGAFPDLGLPHLTRATSEDLMTCQNLLDGRLNTLKATAYQVQKVARWMQQSAKKSRTPLLILLRRWQLQRFVEKADRQALQYQQQDKKLTAYVDRLLLLMKKQGLVIESENDPHQPPLNQGFEALATLYAKLNTTTLRLAQLRPQVTRAQQSVSRMQTWLKNQEAAIATANSSTPPPTPLAVAMAKAKVNAQVGITSQNRHTHSQSRRSLAETFWDEVSQRPLPDSKAASTSGSNSRSTRTPS